MRHVATRRVALGIAVVLALSVAACASLPAAGRVASPTARPSPISSAGTTQAATVSSVVPTSPQPPVAMRTGDRIVAQLPPNPGGVWTAPVTEPAGILIVAADTTPAGTSAVITAQAAGTAVVTFHTTPNGTPRPPGRLPAMTWRLQVTVS